ncbi:hypothetical protein SAMN04487895_101745 [Paenibacillus sophorae]|uniref:Uncharacterized protein n=1 Tax=Paenibacillus sophorae TaxID=1333845 RepID=A0A1H8H449_9BACL|nr:hypothetical protein [Paenibacillus sophorae]QWU14433.1 hypothetical protein KP014_21230 [Paenibacillus sophorae]SEN50789.1 hypothetical protein SAMN04487895_101745 [Paenibacillus sophorae]
MTTYDELYESFLSKCKVDDIDLPSDNSKIYTFIKSSISDYNNRLRDNIVCNDDTESIDRALNDDELLLITKYMRWNLLKNQLTYFASVWQPFSKDLGLKNYQSQIKALEGLVNNEKNEIEQVIINTIDDFM